MVFIKMKHQKRSKEPIASTTGPPKDRSLHKQIRFAFGVLICLLDQHLSVTFNQMTEIVSVDNPTLPEGRLNYVTNLKRTGSTAPGIFIYNALGTPSSTSQTLKFFDSEPVTSFVHDYTISVPQPGQMSKIGAFPHDGLLLGNVSIADSETEVGIRMPLSYNTDLGIFVASNSVIDNKLEPNSFFVLPRSSDSSNRVMLCAGNNCSFYVGYGTTFQAIKTITFETENREYIDQVTIIGKYALYMHRIGYIFWDDETVEQNSISKLIIPNFQPKYAVGDFSRPCNVENCDIVVFQERDDNVYHLSMLSVKIVLVEAMLDIAALKFTSLDVSTVATVNMPVMFPLLNAVALAGSTRFRLYNIFEKRFEENTDFTFLTYDSIQPDSLRPGDFDQSKYRYHRPCMAMFKTEDSRYQPRMFVLSANRCKTELLPGTCAECQQNYGLNAARHCLACDFKHCAVTGRDCLCTTCDAGYEVKPGTKHCQSCGAATLGYQGVCYSCNGINSPALRVDPDTGEINCVEKQEYFNSGWGPDTSITGVLFLEECRVEGCKKCETSSLNCSGCIENQALVLHLDKCTRCSRSPSEVIFVSEGVPRCVNITDPLFAEGYRRDPTQSTFYLLQPCTVENCKTCASAANQCDDCKGQLYLVNNACSIEPPPVIPTPPEPPVTPSPPEPPVIPNPTDPPVTPKPSAPSAIPVTSSFMSVSNNAFGFTFGVGQSRTIRTLEVYDLNSNTNLSCEQVGCKYFWKGAFLRVSFTPSVTVTNGNLIIRRKQSQTSAVSDSSQHSRNRLLQTLDDSDIVIPNIKLTQTPGFLGWVTTGQVVLYLLRTVGSALIFPKYPKLAMIPDLLITICFILCAFLGPVILMADSAFEVVGQVKILWFRMGGLFEDWDTHTLSQSTAPNTWKYPIFCSFLDNYSQNTIGLLALALILTLVGYGARRFLQNKQSSPRMLVLATNIEKHYGTKFFLAKVYANSLEILMYSLISFDKADASSKSIIGIMLAAVLVGIQVWLAVGTTLTSISQTDSTTQAEASRPYETRPDTVIMTEATHLTSSSRPQIKFTEKVLGALSFGWQQMPPTNLKKVSKSKAFLETAFFLRNLGICLVILKIVSSPQAQLIVAMCFQFFYMCYFIYCDIYLERLEFVATLSLEVLMFLVILLKTLSTIPLVSESNLQNTLGLLLLLMLVLAIILTTGSFGLALVWSFRSEEKKVLEPTSFKPCELAQPTPHGDGASPVDQTPANLRVIMRHLPIPSPTEAEPEQAFSMQSVPDEGINTPIPARSVSDTDKKPL